jgi:hypothetical protein
VPASLVLSALSARAFRSRFCVVALGRSFTGDFGAGFFSRGAFRGDFLAGPFSRGSIKRNESAKSAISFAFNAVSYAASGHSSLGRQFFSDNLANSCIENRISLLVRR